MKLRGFIILLFTLLLSCNSDSDPIDPNPVVTNLADVVSLYINANDEVILQEVVNNGEDFISTNITQELGVPFDYLFERVNGSTISFYDKSPENYGIYEKNLLSGAITSVPNVCDPSTGGVSVIAGISESKYWLITDSETPDEIFLRIMDKQTGDCIIKSLGEGIIPGFRSATTAGESLFFFKVVGGAQPILMKINLLDGEIEKQIFVNEFRTITMDGSILYILYPDNSIEIYNAIDLVLSDSGTLGSNFFAYSFGFDPGRAWLNQFYIEVPLPQPALYPSSPAVVDITTGQIIKGGVSLILNIQQNLESVLGESVELLSYDVNLQNDELVFAYSVGSTGENGILFTNFQAEILKTTIIDERPYEVILR